VGAAHRPAQGGGVVVYGIIVVAVLYAGLSHAWRTGWAEMQAHADAQVQQVAEAQAAKLELARQTAQATIRLHQHCQQYPQIMGAKPCTESHLMKC
jgi:hypothetical protein